MRLPAGLVMCELACDSESPRSNTEFVTELIKEGVQVEAQGLHVARIMLASSNHAADVFGRTPLHEGLVAGMTVGELTTPHSGGVGRRGDGGASDCQLASGHVCAHQAGPGLCADVHVVSASTLWFAVAVAHCGALRPGCAVRVSDQLCCKSGIDARVRFASHARTLLTSHATGSSRCTPIWRCCNAHATLARWR